jgi:sterol desaturase/sphingolipid hydroxylase (fatty acid hydroxylase superfamily)
MKLFTMEHGPLAYKLDFLLHGAGVAALAVVLYGWAPSSQGRLLAMTTALGLLAWTLIEYLLHRFVLHGLAPFSRWHQQHHQRPTALICSPTVMSMGLIAVLVFLPAWWGLGLWRATAFTLGVSLGYLAYAVVHHATHHWPAGQGWFRARKRWHAQHHRHDQVRFGVTTSLWDHLLGSAMKPALPAPRGTRGGNQHSEGARP